MRPREIPERRGIVRRPPFGIRPAEHAGWEATIGEAAGDGFEHAGNGRSDAAQGTPRPVSDREPVGLRTGAARPHAWAPSRSGGARRQPEVPTGAGLIRGLAEGAAAAAAITVAVAGTWWLVTWLGGGMEGGWTGRVVAIAAAATLGPLARSLWPRPVHTGRADHRPHRPRAAVQDPLLRVAERLTEVSSLADVLGVVTEESARALRSPVGVFLEERGTDELRLAAGHGLPASAVDLWPAVSRPEMDMVFGSGRVAVIDDMRRGGLPGAEIHAAVGVRSAALARMTRSTRPVGVLAALSLDEHRTFSEEDLQLLRCLADQATQAVASARLLEHTERQLRMTQGLRNVDIAIAGSMDLRVTLNVILHETVRQLGVDAAAVLLLDRRSRMLVCTASHGFRGRGIGERHIRLDEGLAGRVALERTAVRALLGASSDGSRPVLRNEGFVTYHGLPLVAKGEVQGVLEIYHRGRLDTDAEWSEYAEALAGQAAIAIDSATLFEELQRVNANLVQAYDSTLEGWSRALDLRDRETEGHTQRVTDLALSLAREMGVREDDLVHLRRGAMLHDIGKMGIPDSILLKPGPLTDDEWRVMRQHPVLAYELLTPISYLRPAIDIPYCHHERWDGTGYPRGLRGEDIPLAARIFAVVDVWDALRSDRPYRSAWPAESARQYIHTLRGAHFDPAIVDVFDEIHRA